MRIPRIGLKALMVLVAIPAIDLAAGRALHDLERKTFDGESELYIEEFVPMGLVLQGAMVCLVRSQGRKRKFWAGFVAFGLLVPLSRAWWWYDPPVTYNENDPVTGQIRWVTTPGCAIAWIWSAYSEGFGSIADPIFGEATLAELKNPISYASTRFTCARVLHVLLPSLLAALLGGMIVLAIDSGTGRK